MGSTTDLELLARNRLRPVFYRLLELNPALFCRHHGRFPERHTVTAGTDLVIEGYPSAANSFTRQAFLLTNPGIAVASHLHSVAPLRLARDRGIPAIVLLREPVASVASFLVRFGTSSPARELRRYVRFYRALHSVRDYVLFVPYEDVTADFGSVVDRLNDRFGTSYGAGDAGHDRLAGRVVETILREGGPIFGELSALRSAVKSPDRDPLTEQIARELDRDRLRELLSSAGRYYEAARQWADRQIHDAPPGTPMVEQARAAEGARAGRF